MTPEGRRLRHVFKGLLELLAAESPGWCRLLGSWVPGLLCTQLTALQMFSLAQQLHTLFYSNNLCKLSPFTKCMGVLSLFFFREGSRYSRGQQKTTEPDWWTLLVFVRTAVIDFSPHVYAALNMLKHTQSEYKV